MKSQSCIRCAMHTVNHLSTNSTEWDSKKREINTKNGRCFAFLIQLKLVRNFEFSVVCFVPIGKVSALSGCICVHKCAQLLCCFYPIDSRARENANNNLTKKKLFFRWLISKFEGKTRIQWKLVTFYSSELWLCLCRCAYFHVAHIWHIYYNWVL